MHVGIPIDEDRGLESRVCQHFGSASLFMIVDTDSGACRAVRNENAHHAHGTCQPPLALRGEGLDGLERLAPTIAGPATRLSYD